VTRLAKKLDLHEAMILVLLETKLLTGVPELTTTNLAAVIRARELYVQKDGGPVGASQVGSRARRYPALFRLELVQGMLRVRLAELPRRSQLVAKVVAKKT
jgi:hypothetical protein